MRQSLAKLAMLVPVGGCSIIYNANNIHGDAKVVDVEITTDVNPQLLELDNVYPAQIYEGAGDGGSQPALLVIQGKQIADDAMVTVTSSVGTVQVVDTQLAGDHNFIAITLKAPVDADPMHVEGHMGVLTITVSQAGSSVVKSFPADAIPSGQPAINLVFLDKLTSPITAPPAANKKWAKIDTTVLAFAKTSDKKVVLTSISGVKLTGGINVDGGTPAAGPGGCAGGPKDMNAATSNADMLTCVGAGFTPSGALLSGNGGGGAGYTSAGDPGGGPGGMGGPKTGDPQISTFDSNLASGGGGGASTSLSIAGGAGGGGGGTVQIVAGGDVEIDAPGISAVGGPGAPGTDDGIAGKAGSGGGGAGGTIIVTAHGALTLPTITVIGGGGGSNSGSGSGGAGKAGRARVAAATGTLPSGAYVAPMFVGPMAYTTSMTTTFHFRGQPGTSDVLGRVFNSRGILVNNATFPVNFGGTGNADADVTLGAGYNNVCVTVKDGSAIVDDESTTCTEIAYLPPAHPQ